MKHPNFSIHLRLLGMAALWGGSWPWGRVVAQAMPPLAAASLRFLLASLVLLPWLFRKVRGNPWRRLSSGQWFGLFAASAVGVFGYSTCFMLGLRTVAAGKASLVVAFNPAVTLLLAAWIFREPLNHIIAMGMVLAVSGALIVLTHGAPWRILAGDLGMGELLLLGGVACWVAYPLIGKVVLTDIDALTTTATTTLLGSAMLCTLSLAVEGTAGWARLAEGPANAWLALVALAYGATALAYAWFFDGVKALGASPAAGYISLVPVFGVIFSALWLGEALDASLLIGGLAAVMGMVIMHLGRMGVKTTPA